MPPATHAAESVPTTIIATVLLPLSFLTGFFGMNFAFTVNHGGIDGVDFADNCAQTLKLVLAVNGHHLNHNRVYIGAHSARPAHNPFVISRGDVAPAA